MDNEDKSVAPRCHDGLDECTEWGRLMVEIGETGKTVHDYDVAGVNILDVRAQKLYQCEICKKVKIQ